MPLGGIGAGCICLNGYGGLQDFSIRNQPHLTALPDRHLHADAAFGLLRLPKWNITKLVEGPFPVGKIYDQGLKAQGHWGSGQEGFPRFRECTFTGEYPFGYVRLADPELPLTITITGFNPFIPLDVKNSAIPCAILEYQIENPSNEAVEFEFSYHLSHLAPGPNPKEARTSRNTVLPGKGVLFTNAEDPGSAEYGSAALTVVGHPPLIKAMWFRGRWIEGISVLWQEISSGKFLANDGSGAENRKGRNGGSLLIPGILAPGEKVTIPIVITWLFPNVHYSVAAVKGEETCSATCACGQNPSVPKWRPYYASHWSDAGQVAMYVHENYECLRRRTQAFHDALFSSTLPRYVLEAVSANLAIIKSPTVLLQENGQLWGWEGCFSDRGCCSGSCTHVWNYAQAIPHLYPQLERTLREQELLRSMDERGHVNFRSVLPDGPTDHSFHAASDGQLGGVLKVYREWQISGDRDWLVKMYPLVKRSLQYCIETWDPRERGVLEEPHHNTYDIEFWGPNGMCSSVYVTALCAMAMLAVDSGHPEDAPYYKALALRGAGCLDDRLFNGEYYEQQVIYRGLRDTSFQEYVDGLGEGASAEDRLLKEEGPKHQYGSGCLSDGVIGAWLGAMCGVDPPLPADHIRQALKSIFTYNFHESLWNHSNSQRPGYAMGDEPGLVLCTWPHGNRPTLPFIYADEVWTGIEYQVASHMILMGLVDEGLTIVRALRSRYDGRVRNPWNEYECGSYYARAMASFALLASLSGFSYSAVTHTLVLQPRLAPGNYKTFFSSVTGWGTISVLADQVVVEMSEGELIIDHLQLTRYGRLHRQSPGITARSGAAAVIELG